MEQDKIKINGTIVTGRKFKRLDNSETKNWDRICLTILGTSDDFEERLKNMHPVQCKRRENNGKIGFN